MHLGISFEILLLSCSDENADVRLNSEECMNRLIKVLYETSIHRILVELFKEIKKVGLLLDYNKIDFVVCRYLEYTLL